MSANLAQTAANDVMMAYQGETPWHQSGTKVTDPKVIKSVPLFLEAASLNWDVQLKPMLYRSGDKWHKVPTRRAVVRNTDGKLLATVGAGYHAFQNSEAFAVLQPALDRFGVELETAGALGAGDRVWMLAKLPRNIEPIPGDVIKNYIMIMTGHNGWTAYTSRLTQVRAVCENTINLALRDDAFARLRHVETEVDRLTQISDIITGFLEVAKKTGESYQKLAAKKLTDDEIKLFVEKALDLDFDNPVAARRRDRIVELSKTGKGVELAPGTAWTAFNAITEYIDHVRPAEAKAARTIKQANQSALFGTNARLKARALVLANKIAA